MARPSGSRTIWATTISTGMFRSRTIRLMMATWAASFCPKTAISGSTMWKELRHHSGYSAKVSGARLAVETLAQTFDVYVSYGRCGIHLVRPRERKAGQRFRAEASRNRARTNVGTWRDLLWVRIAGVDEQADYHEVALCSGSHGRARGGHREELPWWGQDRCAWLGRFRTAERSIRCFGDVHDERGVDCEIVTSGCSRVSAIRTAGEDARRSITVVKPPFNYRRMARLRSSTVSSAAFVSFGK